MPSSAYIHIPFCKSKCNYCSFVSFTGCNNNIKENYIDALVNEIKSFYKNEPLKTLYFGGGTPSLLDIGLIEKVLNCFILSDNAEITIEINPETVDVNYLESLKNIGFNRLSIGVQSFSDLILKQIGRIHTSKKAIETIKNAQNVGFNNVSVDFIYGLPSQDVASFANDLEFAIDLGVQHISLYGLKIEEGCYFYNNRPLDIADDDLQAEMYLNAIDTLESSCFKHYEISNFAKDGFESNHNLNYWNCKEYYGFGVAAHGYVNGTRYSNILDIESYISNFKIKDFEQNLTNKDMLEEMIFLGFRRGIGINVNEINEKFSINFDVLYKDILSKYIASGHIIKTLIGYRFSNEGFLLSNIILSEFID